MNLVYAKCCFFCNLFELPLHQRTNPSIERFTHTPCPRKNERKAESDEDIGHARMVDCAKEPAER